MFMIWKLLGVKLILYLENNSQQLISYYAEYRYSHKIHVSQDNMSCWNYLNDWIIV